MDIIFHAFYKKKGINFLLQTSRSYRQLLTENQQAASYCAEDALDHIEDLPCTISQLDLVDNRYDPRYPLLVHLSGERVFACTNENLYVFSVREPKFPIASYRLGEVCCSAKIIENRLYLGWETRQFVQVFEVPTSLTEPLTFVKEIKTKDSVFYILRNRHELMIVEYDGWLEVFDIISATITHSFQIKKLPPINDIVAIDKTHYLLASSNGLFKSTNDQIITHYYQGKYVKNLCHITDLIYLVALYEESLVVRDEQSD